MDSRGVRRPPPTQRSILLTLGAVTVVSVLVVYVFVGRHLKKFDEVAISLFQRLEQQSSFQSLELREIVTGLRNETNSMSLLLGQISELQGEKFRKVSLELRNHSRLVALAIHQQSSLYSQQIQDLATAVRESTLGQSGFSIKRIQGLLTNQTAFTIATLHSQRRMEKDLVEVLRLLDDKAEGGKDFQKSVEINLQDISSAMKKHTEIQKSSQVTLDVLSALLTSQKATSGSKSSSVSTSEQDKIHEVLKALVAHLRNQDKEASNLGSNSILLSKVDTLLTELKNQTSLGRIRQTVRQQTLAVAKLRTQLTEFESRLFESKGSESSSSAEFSDLKEAVLRLLQQSQKHSDKMDELRQRVDSLLLMAGGSTDSEDAKPTVPNESTLASLLQELKNQTRLMSRLDARMSRIEGKVGLKPDEGTGGEENVAQNQSGEEEGSGEAGTVAEEAPEPPVDVSDPGHWLQHQIAGQSGTFMRYSGYRIGQKQMVGIGLSTKAVTESLNMTVCTWVGRESSITGSLQVLFATENPSRQYDVTLLLCTFEETVEAQGGYMAATIDKVEYVLYREEIGEVSKLDPEAPFQHAVTVCVVPSSSSRFDVRVVREFVELHRLMGVSRFLFFDSGGVQQAMAASFKAEIDSGLLEVSPLRNVKLDQQGDGELLAYHDCIYSSRYNSEWVAFVEANEVLNVGANRNLLGILSVASRLGKAWLSHGSIWWSSQKCQPAFNDSTLVGDYFSIERMIYRWPFPVCHNKGVYPDSKFCLGVLGHRRLVVNPRVVRRMDAYGPHIEDSENGLHLSIDEMSHLHYQNLLEGSTCSEVLQNEEPIVWWYRNFDGMKLAWSLRQGYTCNFTVGACALSGDSKNETTIESHEGAETLNGKTSKEVEGLSSQSDNEN